MRIPARKVVITLVFLVDCEVCGEAVEPESGSFPARAEAAEAKRRHLDQHASGDFDSPNPHVVDLDRRRYWGLRGRSAVLERPVRIPANVRYRRARSGRGRNWHIEDWRRQDIMQGLCTHPLNTEESWVGDPLAWVTMPPSPICVMCTKKLQELRLVKVYVGDKDIDISGLTVSQVVDLALKNQVPPDAVFAVKQDYCDYSAVLQWAISE